MTVGGASGRAVQGDSGSRSSGPGAGGIVIAGSGIVAIIGLFLPWLQLGPDGGSTIDTLQAMSEIETWWPVLLVACAIVIAGAGVVYLADPGHSRTAIPITVAAAIGLGIGLAVGPGRFVIEGSSEFYSIGLFPTGGYFSVSLGWGTWVMAMGMVGALVGAGLASGDRTRTQAPSPGSRQGRTAAPVFTTASPRSPVPDALIGPPSAGPASGPMPLDEAQFSDGDAEELIDRMVKLEQRQYKRRGFRVVEAVWLSYSPTRLAVALGLPDTTYRARWPGRPTVRWAPPKPTGAEPPTSRPPLNTAVPAEPSPTRGAQPSDVQPAVTVPLPPVSPTHTAPSAAVPTADAAPPTAEEPGQAPAPGPATVASRTAERELKMCPDCAEMIYVEARLCRYCRHDFANHAS